jgi:transposase
MDRQTLRGWVHRYNEGGVAALASGKSTGRRPKLDAAQMAQLYDLVIKGPDPEIDGVVRWRCVDLRAQIAHCFSVDVPERTVAKWLRRLRLTRLQLFIPSRTWRRSRPLARPKQHAMWRFLWACPSHGILSRIVDKITIFSM